MIEPGGVKTPGLGKANQWVEQLSNDGPPELASRYGAMIATMIDTTTKIDRQTGIEASVVAKVIGKALTVHRPRIHGILINRHIRVKPCARFAIAHASCLRVGIDSAAC